jgi:hypothetical protein
MGGVGHWLWVVCGGQGGDFVSLGLRKGGSHGRPQMNMSAVLHGHIVQGYGNASTQPV